MKKSLLCLLIILSACQPKKEEQATNSSPTPTVQEQAPIRQEADNQENTTQAPTTRPDFPIGSVVYILGKEDARPAPKKEDQPQREDFALGTKLEIVGEEGPYYKVKKGAHESYVLKSEVGYKDESSSGEKLSSL